MRAEPEPLPHERALRRHDDGEVHAGVRIALCTVDALVAVTAIAGGLALVAGGEGARFPAAWLRGTPFSSYVAPGLILAVAVGGSAARASAATLRRPRIGGPASVLAGAVLLGWIAGEVVLLKQTPPGPTLSEAVYFAAGLLMVGLGLAAWQRHRRKHS
jgi:hypothetical protein